MKKRKAGEKVWIYTKILGKVQATVDEKGGLYVCSPTDWKPSDRREIGSLKLLNREPYSNNFLKQVYNVVRRFLRT